MGVIVSYVFIKYFFSSMEGSWVYIRMYAYTYVYTLVTRSSYRFRGSIGFGVFGLGVEGGRVY